MESQAVLPDAEDVELVLHQDRPRLEGERQMGVATHSSTSEHNEKPLERK